MEEMAAASAKQRMCDVFYMLLQDTPYQNIKVTRIVQLAEVNRSTFYKYYTSVPDLFEHLQRALCDEITGTHVLPPETPETMRAFTRHVFDAFVQDHRREIRLLGGNHGDVRTFWYIGEAMRELLTREADRLGVTDAAVRRNIAGAPGFFASLLCSVVNREMLLASWSRFQTAHFDESKTFFENMAIQLQMQRGGPFEFHYDLTLSYVKFFDRMVPQVTVTQLLQTAGISRTEFYQYYRNMNDFHQTYIDAVCNCATMYVVHVCRVDAETGVALMERFSEINYSFVHQILRGVVERGDIIFYLTYLIGSVYFVAKQTLPPTFPLAEQQQLELLYGIGATISFALAFYTGKLDKAALNECLHSLEGLRKSIRAEDGKR